MSPRKTTIITSGIIFYFFVVRKTFPEHRVLIVKTLLLSAVFKKKKKLILCVSARTKRCCLVCTCVTGVKRRHKRYNYILFVFYDFLDVSNRQFSREMIERTVTSSLFCSHTPVNIIIVCMG